MIDRMSQAARPEGRPAGFQRWRKLLFLHWEVPTEAVATTLPEGLEVDHHDGRALLGVVPFTMQDVSPWWSPSVPGISNFHELNLRTYVVHDGVPGVWFYSLEAANALAVVVARTGWKLPYHKASMELHSEPTDDGEVITYRSERRWPEPKPATFSGRWRVGAEVGTATPGTFEHYLVERYILYTTGGDGQLLSGHVHHKPYPLRDVTVDSLQQTITAAAGFEVMTEEPICAHYSDGVDVDVFSLEPVR